MTIHENIADSAKGLCGHLECEQCGRTQELKDTAHYFAHGWPVCCGYTMRWLTATELKEREREV